MSLVLIGETFTINQEETMEKVKKRKEIFTKAQKAAEERVLNALVGERASVATKESCSKKRKRRKTYRI